MFRFLFTFCVLLTISSLFAQECEELEALGHPLTVTSKPFPKLGLTITNFSLDWLEKGGNSFFEIYVDPALSEVANSGRLRLAVQLTATIIGEGTPITIKDDVYTLEEQHVGRVVISDELFQIPSRGVDIGDDFISDISDKNGNLRPTRLNAKFFLTCQSQFADARSVNWQEVADLGRIDGSFGGTIDPTIQNIDAISPGTKNPQAAPIIQEQFPIFHFSSKLTSSDIKYESGETKFVIYLAEIQDGESAIDVLNDAFVPFITISEGEPTASVPYPLNKPPLKQGAKYGWKIAMRLRGPQERWVHSDPLFFQVAKNDPNLILRDVFTTNKEVEGFAAVGDNYSKRLMAALKIILEENYPIFIATLGNKVPIKGQIRWNGQPYSLEQLEKLARSFAKKNNTLTRMRFR